jgi:hypothetical protein
MKNLGLDRESGPFGQVAAIFDKLVESAFEESLALKAHSSKSNWEPPRQNSITGRKDMYLQDDA